MRRFFFDLYEGIRIAGQAIWANKLRSVLTTLGIIIGIASVTLMATVISGINQEFEKALSQMGADVVYVSKWPWGSNPGLKWWDYVNRPPIRAELAGPIRARSSYAEAVAPLVNTQRTAAYRENSMSVTVNGSTPEYGRIRNVELAQGRFYAESDERAARNVCVIGATIADELFPIATPLGKNVQVGGMPCRVIGVQEKQGKSIFGGESADQTVLMPFKTFEKLFGISRYRSTNIMVKIPSADDLDRAKDELTGIVRTARQVEPTADDNFDLNDQKQVSQSFSATKTAIYGVGLFLTGLALIVGGIGVSNIMFVLVRERTKEIGIRKAVGAKRWTILLQFLIEAIIICLIGGVIGVGVSSLLVATAGSIMGFAPVLPVSTVAIAFFICVLVGIVAGMKAATADPITALRYE